MRSASKPIDEVGSLFVIYAVRLLIIHYNLECSRTMSTLTATPQPFNHLPWEISDAIIGHLHEDRPSLHSCALVCHAWLPSSRHHLSRRVWVADLVPREPNTVTIDKALDFLFTTLESAATWPL